MQHVDKRNTSEMVVEVQPYVELALHPEAAPGPVQRAGWAGP